MKNITTNKALFNWLYKQVVASEPQITVTPGLLHLGEVIRSEVADVGYLARYDTECWVATFDDILRGVSKPGEARCGEKLIPWLARVYAEVAAEENMLVLPAQRINQISISVLRLAPRFLTVTPKGRRERIESTAEAELTFRTRVRVSARQPKERDTDSFCGLPIF